MDQLILEATEHRGLESGDVVTLLGRDGEETISRRTWAQLAGSVPWEVLCSFKLRLRRLVIWAFGRPLGTMALLLERWLSG